MSAHALLGPSSGDRWLTCTPSARAAEGEEDRRSNFADEGSFAHAVAEHCLTHKVTPDQLCGVEPWEQSEYWTQDLRDHVQTYIDYIDEVVAAAGPSAFVAFEVKLDLSMYAPESFGTADCVVIDDGTLSLIDLKFGKGIAVSALDNTQLKLYALGALTEYGFLYGVTNVRLHIVQPRIMSSASTDDITPEALLAWGESIKPRAEMAWLGTGEFVAGEHCMWCRIKGKCRARAAQMQEVAAKYDKRKAAQMTPAEIAEALKHTDDLISWAGDIKDHALTQAKDVGVRFPGWKLVEGRSNRRYYDTEKVAIALRGAGFAVNEIHKPPELLGITAMEALVGKKKFSVVLDGLIEKPAGKPVLVPAEDKRDEITGTAAVSASDFDGV